MACFLVLASLIGSEAFAPPRHRKKNVALALFTSDVETVGLVKSNAGVVIRRVAAEDDIGLGAFAGRPFEAGELLGEYVGASARCAFATARRRAATASWSARRTPSSSRSTPRTSGARTGRATATTPTVTAGVQEQGPDDEHVPDRAAHKLCWCSIKTAIGIVWNRRQCGEQGSVARGRESAAVA